MSGKRPRESDPRSLAYMNPATVVEKKDEKVEKRKALGRGLASLLPGPRVVGSGEVRVPTRERNDLPQGGKPQVIVSAEADRSPELEERSAGGEEAKVPRFARDDNRGEGGENNEIAGKTKGTDASSTANEPSPGIKVGGPGVAGPTSALVSSIESVPEEFGVAVSAPAPQEADENDVISIQAAVPPANSVVQIDIALIERNPYQTRYIFDKDMLQELAESIKTNGVVQPIVVRPGEKEGRYVLVLGERRLRASKLAGKSWVPALIRRLSPQQAAEMTVLENIQRQDLNAVEQAEAFRVLSTEFQLTQAQIAQRIGVSRETVSNYMRLLRLPEEVMQYVLDEQITFSEAREILSLDNDENIPILAKEAVEKQLNLAQIEHRVREFNGFVAMEKAEGWETRAAARRSARWQDPNVRAAQTEMERTLGMRVRIKDRNGKGRITIEYASVDDYQLLMEMLRGKKK